MKDIPGYENIYSATEDGRVWSHRRNKFMSPYTDRNGYHQLVLIKDKKPKCFWVARIIANTFIPKIDGKNIINHKNGVKTDNSVNNLEWCTTGENIRHSRDILGNFYGNKYALKNGKYVGKYALRKLRSA